MGSHERTVLPLLTSKDDLPNRWALLNIYVWAHLFWTWKFNKAFHFLKRWWSLSVVSWQPPGVSFSMVTLGHRGIGLGHPIWQTAILFNPPLLSSLKQWRECLWGQRQVRNAYSVGQLTMFIEGQVVRAVRKGSWFVVEKMLNDPEKSNGSLMFTKFISYLTQDGEEGFKWWQGWWELIFESAFFLRMVTH